MVQILYY